MTHPVASATLQLRISAIRLWYDFLFYQGNCDHNPVPRTLQRAAGFSARELVPRIVKRPRIPDDPGWFALLRQAAHATLRDRLMLPLAYYGALRRAELVALRIDDLDPGHRLIRIRAGTTKSRRERVVCYSTTVTPMLAAHLQQLRREGHAGGALFRSVSDRNHGVPLSIWSWSKTVRRWAIQAELPDSSTHNFRHLRLRISRGPAGDCTKSPPMPATAIPEPPRYTCTFPAPICRPKWPGRSQNRIGASAVRCLAARRCFIQTENRPR